MLETLNINEKLDFQPLSAEEKLKRGILGRLTGPVASFRAPTRNGRKYSEELWEKVFENDLVKELFSRGGIPGELDHPDRDETCSEKIAIMMPEKPKKNKNGNLVGYFDILDTPCGRIAATLAKYGFQFGISSRGSGDTFTDYDGQESVDPDSYTLNAFDLVLIPACKNAVLSLVENKNRPEKPLSTALNEALESANDTDRAIMVEALDNLKIDYNSEEEVEDISESDNNIEAAQESVDEAENSGAAMLEELQEALKANAELEAEIKSLREQLSVCYTKEGRYATILDRTKIELAEANRETAAAQAETSKLNEKLNSLRDVISNQNVEIKTLNESLDSQKQQITDLNKALKSNSVAKTQLNESFVAKTAEVKTLTEKLASQKSAYEQKISKLNDENRKLVESLNDSQKDSQILQSQSTAKITKYQQLTEKYKAVAKTAVDKYIDCRATTLGISAKEIKSRLSENYSFNDIDKVCQDLQRYKVSMQSLPFDIKANQQIRMKITESKKPVDPVSSDNGIDDDIDEALRSFM